jgi:hypothetical protein
MRYADPYQYYYSRMYDGEYMQPPMWQPFYHPHFNYNYNSERPSLSQQTSKDCDNYQQYYPMPPPLLPPNFGFFRNQHQNSSAAKPPEFPGKAPNEGGKSRKDEPAPLGSEAARERERTEIANRLMGLDNKKTPPGCEATQAAHNNKSSAPLPSKKPTGPSTKLTKKISPTISKQKQSDKPSKRPAASSNGSSGIPSKKTNTNELDYNILRQITAMGKDEIKGIVNNPQSAKSQDILKALMKHYRELKGIELDKRRLLAPTASTSAQAYNNPVLSNVESIEISDLPMEIINQLNNFLGCDMFGLEDTPQNQVDEVVLLEAETAETPEVGQQQEQFAEVGDAYPEPPRTNNPEKILEELVMIDMRMQADLHRYFIYNPQKYYILEHENVVVKRPLKPALGLTNTCRACTPFFQNIGTCKRFRNFSLSLAIKIRKMDFMLLALRVKIIRNKSNLLIFILREQSFSTLGKIRQNYSFKY